ncbi:hypothetical protein ACFOPN_03780 [Xanthomonas hyacinthi]|uniref:hypothetical protein n=1 Tax=Xanthomonas hyacinthi TaxID=56455 RepID=UPI000A6F6907|nr:hypothetical protein [Xanthomonas hyacinthi]
MRRIYSYAHGAVPYVAPATHLTLAPDILAGYAGDSLGKSVGAIRVVVEGDHLKPSASALVVTLRAETPTRFFAEERDLRIVFAPAADARVPADRVRERQRCRDRAGVGTRTGNAR